MKSGFVTIVGKPNVGKSTLINNILNNKISIVSSKPFFKSIYPPSKFAVKNSINFLKFKYSPPSFSSRHYFFLYTCKVISCPLSAASFSFRTISSESLAPSGVTIWNGLLCITWSIKYLNSWK